MKKAISLGVLASLFFAATFVLNRSMNLGGGYWLWSASLRYLFMLPMTWALASRGNGTKAVLREIKFHPGPWFLWSTVGFGLFYMPLTWASVYGESWFVAATWQLTIVAGILLTPLFGKKIPGKNLACSGVILAGVFLLQAAHFRAMRLEGTLPALALILVAAFSYPLGNRKMMACCPAGFSTFQRVFGMTLCSMPFWLGMSAIALTAHGLPSREALKDRRITKKYPRPSPLWGAETGDIIFLIQNQTEPVIREVSRQIIGSAPLRPFLPA